METFNNYIGKPLAFVVEALKSLGYKVVVKKNSLPKIQTDYELVVCVRQTGLSEVEVISGDFLVNIENKIK